MNRPPYTLQDLADGFGLTARTARHYIEKVLPERHRKGPGKVAEYGQDTWNCFAFIEKARGKDLSLGQITGVLADLDQECVDRVAEGLEEMAIVPIASNIGGPSRSMPRKIARASERHRNFLAESRKPSGDGDQFELMSMMRSPEPEEEMGVSDSKMERSSRRGRVLYDDDELQITYVGKVDPEQREQVRLAARLIKTILRRK